MIELQNVKGWNNASPNVQNSINTAATTYNVDPGTLAQIASAESSFNPRAKNSMPGASASGLFQHTNDTWLGLARQGKIQGIDPGMSNQEILNARFDPQISANGGAALLQQNSQIIGSSEPGDLYLAHFLGPSDAKKVLEAERSGNGDKSLEEILGSRRADAIYSNNPTLKQNGVSTANDMRNWASKKMTGNGVSSNGSAIQSNNTTVKPMSVNSPSIKIISKVRSCRAVSTVSSESMSCSINTQNQSANIGQQNVLPNVDINQLPLPRFEVNTPISDIGTVNGLRVKSGEAVAGGKTHPGTFALGHAIQENVDGVDRFTAFDDSYHSSPEYINGRLAQGKSPVTAHNTGRALDFTLTDPSQSPIATAQTRQLLTSSGTNGYVRDEYLYPSEGATGGHIHVNFNSTADAEKFEQFMNRR